MSHLPNSMSWIVSGLGEIFPIRCQRQYPTLPGPRLARITRNTAMKFAMNSAVPRLEFTTCKHATDLAQLILIVCDGLRFC